MSKKLSLTPPRGFRDFYPRELAIQRAIEARVRVVLRARGYAEYDGPTLEETALYRAKSGDEIASDQAYTFVDKGGREMTLRPEMTPTLARMIAAKRGEIPFPARLFSFPNCFRYERPQRGRVREFRQWNVDLLGAAGGRADAEIIEIVAEIFQKIGAGPEDFEIRVSDRRLLGALFQKLKIAGDPADRLRKIIDDRRKIPAADFVEKISEILADPAREKILADFLAATDPAAAAAIAGADPAIGADLARATAVPGAKFDPTIVRGLAYYTGVVFEVFDCDPVNPRALFGGGRYDDLVGIFGGEAIPAVGFGVSDTSLWNFLEARGLLPEPAPVGDIFLAPLDAEFFPAVDAAAREIRAAGGAAATATDPAKPEKILKFAEKSGFRAAGIVGPRDAAAGEISVKVFATGEKFTAPAGEILKKIRG